MVRGNYDDYDTIVSAIFFSGVQDQSVRGK